MVAWKLTTNFDKQRHLFFETIETDYIVETYICSCGYTDFIIKYPEQELKYICKECENTNFYDANSAWRNITHFLYQNLDLELSCEYNVQSSADVISSHYVTKIPTSIDFANHKVIYSKKTIYSLSLRIDGEFKENYSLRFDQKISSQLKNYLIQYIKKNNYFNIPHSGNKSLTLAMVLFFLKNKHLKDFDFYYWDDISKLEKKEVHINDALKFISNNPRAKTVKKAVYQNYIKQLDDNGRFDSTFVEAFSNHIKDVNILSKLLQLKFEHSVYNNIHKDELNEIIVFLKQHYSEKQLLKFFSSNVFNSNHYLFRDAVNEFLYDKDVIENRFRKVPCNIQALHDELVRCSREEGYKDIIDQKLSYSKEDMKPCIEADTYQVKLPKTGKELLDWANKLHNCMAGYFEMIKNHETIIYCFFQENILVFAVEICDNEVVQASGKYNATLTIEENKILTKWFELFFKKNTQKIANVA